MNATPEQQKIIDDFDALTKKRAKELLEASKAEGKRGEILTAIRESAFCLGYKAGVIDSAPQYKILLRVFEAASAWEADPTDATAAKLVAAIQEARKP